MEQAHDFIMENLGNVGNIYNVCQQFGVNNDMIAEILQSDFPGLSGSLVSNVFSNNGYNGDALGFNAPTPAISNTHGTLNLSNLGNYSAVVLYENVSQYALDEAYYLGSEGIDYMYASNDTWDSIRDLGFTANYTSAYNGGYEVSYSNDYTTTAIGIDWNQVVSDAYLASLMADYGFDGEHTLIEYTGTYDLIIAM